MESSRYVWRNGIAPLLSSQQLEALRVALVYDDPRLIQGGTTSPRPIQCMEDWPVEGACALGYCGWQAEGLVTVGQVEEFFGRLCAAIDDRLGEPHVCRYFITWFDDTPRTEMRRWLLCEVQRELALRLLDEGDSPRPLAG